MLSARVGLRDGALSSWLSGSGSPGLATVAAVPSPVQSISPKSKPEADAVRRPGSDESRWRRIWTVVRTIPRGRVATYGQVAALAGFPGAARQVGYALAALPAGTSVPWQRVVNARGEISARRDFDGAPRQRLLLLEEGVVFGPGGRIDLARFGWEPRAHSIHRDRGGKLHP